MFRYPIKGIGAPQEGDEAAASSVDPLPGETTWKAAVRMCAKRPAGAMEADTCRINKKPAANTDGPDADIPIAVLMQVATKGSGALAHKSIYSLSTLTSVGSCL